MLFNLALKGHSDQLRVVDLNMCSYNIWAAAKLKAPLQGQLSKGFGCRPWGAYVAMHLLNEHLYAHADVVYIFRLLMSYVLTYRIWCSSWFTKPPYNHPFVMWLTFVRQCQYQVYSRYTLWSRRCQQCNVMWLWFPLKLGLSHLL
jgi:hypothetical protein